MPTLSAVRSLLWPYASSVPYATALQADKDAFDSRLNQTCERFLRAGYSNTVVAALTVYSDMQGNSVITLPPELNAVLGAVGCGPLQVRSSWYEYMPANAGPFSCDNSGIVALPGKFTTFQDWNVPYRLRIKMDYAETVRFIIRGNLQGQKIFTTDSGNWIEGVAMNFTTSDITSSQLFDEPPYAFVKPQTKGRVYLYVVDVNNVATLVAIYEPQQTVCSFHRYKVPYGTATPIITSDNSSLPNDVYSKENINAMFGGGLTLTVSTTGTTALAPANPFVQWFQKIIVASGGGAYTRAVTLDNTMARPGAIFRIAMEIAQSANPTVQVYDISGALLDSIAGDSDNALYYYGEYQFDGINWSKIEGHFLT